MSDVPVEIGPETVVTPARRVRAREIGGESVLVDLAGGTYFGLNDVGTVIWSRIAAGDPLRTVCQAVVEAFEVEPGRAWTDLVELVRELMAHGLVTVSVSNPT